MSVYGGKYAPVVNIYRHLQDGVCDLAAQDHP